MSGTDAQQLLVEEGVPYAENCTVFIDEADAADTDWSARLIIVRNGTTILTLTEGSGVVTTPGDGRVTIAITLSASQTGAFNWPKADYQLDVLKAGVVAVRALKDKLVVDRDVLA